MKVDIHNRGNPLAYWGFRILLAGVTACVPVFITSYFNYKAVKAEQIAGYEQTKLAVEQLQRKMEINMKELAYLKGRVDQRAIRADADAPPAPVQFVKLPSFDDVVKQAAKK